MSFSRQELAERAAALATQGVYVGTPSWKYAGWCGTLYGRARYEYRGKFAETRFKRDCLAEYSDVFKTVCVDAAYYTFPSRQYLEGMVNQTPDDFLFGCKVTDAVTIKKFPKLDRFGEQAGKPNESLLNADLFVKAFLAPCEAVRDRIGLLMFEFSRFWPTDYEHGRDFIADLDRFLGRLPTGWPYGVEMRNRNWLEPEYFDCLARHRVAHVFNSWEAMPPVGEQMALPGSQTNPVALAKVISGRLATRGATCSSSGAPAGAGMDRWDFSRISRVSCRPMAMRPVAAWCGSATRRCWRKAKNPN